MGPKSRRRSRLLLPTTTVLLLLLAAPSSHAYQQPFRPAETAPALARRQSGGCIADFYSCANLGAAWAGICCQNGQICAVDASNSPACCPSNAVCTGTAPSTLPSSLPTAPVSFVPNGYFSFPYAATSFSDPGACSAAASQCARNYDSCTSQLEGLAAGAGSPYGVTIIVPGGGGTTVAGAGVTVAAPTATSVCSSLSSVACGALGPGVCASAGATVSGFYVGAGRTNAAAAAPTAAVVCRGVAAAGVIAAGVGLGVMNVL